MSYIIKQNSGLINTKLTDLGRNKLSLGRLNFSYFRLGDSELSYNSFPTTDYSGFNILRPKDNNPDIKYPLIPNPSIPTGTTFVNITNLTSSPILVNNSAKQRGFFTGTTNNFSAYTDTKYILLQGTTPASGMTGGRVINIRSGSTAYNYQPVVGDLISVRWTNPILNTTLPESFVNSTPTPVLFYMVEGVTGFTSANTLSILVDRDIPNFTFFSGLTNSTALSYVNFYPSGDSINNYYGADTPIPYWNELTLEFDSNCINCYEDVPVWNLNIPFTETIAGVSGNTFETYTAYGSTGYTGTKEYLDYGSVSGDQKSIAILHYTNNTISNFYGEGFYLNSTKVHMPTLMYHRKLFTGGSGQGNQIGYTFSADTTLKQIVSPFDSNSVIEYYDLVDTEINKTAVGKVFPDLKIIAIEDEEIVAAMSYKSNRNWTLPKPKLNTVPVGTCDSTSTTGVLKTQAEELYVTYVLESNSGYTTGLHCQYYQKISLPSSGERDVTVEFPIDSFPYLKDLALSGGTGFQADKITLLFQKVGIGERPEPDKWLATNVNFQLTCSTCPLDGKDLERTKFYITDGVYNSGTSYNVNTYLNIPTLGEPNRLNFGDERFFYGSIDTDIKATVYRTNFTFLIGGSLFALSQNPTFDPQEHIVNISEIGVYDESFDLVAIGKLSQPIPRPLNSGAFILNISIDF